MSDLLDRLQDMVDCKHDDKDVAREAIEEIARLRADLANAWREGMKDAAKRLEELHKNHKYNPQTGEGSWHDVGYYRALSEGAVHILYAAAPDDRPSEEIIREDRDAWPDHQANDPIRAAAKEGE